MSNNTTVRLSPAQQGTFEALSAGMRIGSILRLWGGVGRGKTTILNELHKKVGGAFLNVKDFVEASAGSHPLALEETFYRVLFDALKAHPTVMIDDVHLVDVVWCVHFN